MSPTFAQTSRMYETIDVEATLSKMTVSEKIQVTAGEDFWHFKGIERLGVPSPRCSDGPNGARIAIQCSHVLPKSLTLLARPLL